MINYKQKFERLWQEYLKNSENDSISKMLIYLSDKSFEVELEKALDKRVNKVVELIAPLVILFTNLFFNDNFTNVDNTAKPTLTSLINELKASISKSDFDIIEEIRKGLIDPSEIEVCNLIEELLFFQLSELGIKDLIQKLAIGNKVILERIYNILNPKQQELINKIRDFLKI